MEYISVCITNYNRYELLLKSFEGILSNNWISEIIIVDDDSDKEIYDKIKIAVQSIPKIKLYRNFVNIGMSENKAVAISCSSNPFCIVFDSDNELFESYITALEQIEEFKEDTIYLPVGALPNFIFEDFSGLTIDRHNIKDYMNNPMFRVALNSCNYLVNRDFYLESFKSDPTIGCADTINHAFNHLMNDGKLYFVPNMRYNHLVGSQSGYLHNVEYNMKKSAEIENKIRKI